MKKVKRPCRVSEGTLDTPTPLETFMRAAEVLARCVHEGTVLPMAATLALGGAVVACGLDLEEVELAAGQILAAHRRRQLQAGRPS